MPAHAHDGHGAPGGHLHARGDDATAHAPGRLGQRRRLAIVLAGGTAIMAVEIVGGLASGSLVLLADAAHYATDLLSVLLALVAVTWARRPADVQRSFGYQRAEVVAAFVQALALIALAAYFVWEALVRLVAPPPVDGPLLLAVGAGTLVANACLALLLRGHAHTNVNMKAAYLHILSDVLGSAAAVGAGVAVAYLGWAWADPALTILVTVLIVGFAWRLLRQTLHILLEGAPEHASVSDVRAALGTIPGIADVHDVHVWSLTSGTDSVSAHVVLAQPLTNDETIHLVQATLKERFGIEHVTVQVEDPGCPCTGTRHST